jgi:non-canonical (house-cleaning) NTP pyrophosphatase
MTDGVDGARARIAAARTMVSDFGVATECGMGHRPAETIARLLEIHAEVSDPL